MPDTGVTAIVAFVAVASLSLLVLSLVGGRKTPLDRRLAALSTDEAGEPEAALDPMAEFARTALPKMGAVLVPEKEEERTKLQTRLVHAGLYGRQAMAVFLGVKLLLIVGPAALGAVVGVLGLVPFQIAMIVGCLLGAFGLIGPSFWLDVQKGSRQTTFRRSLPDALDVLVICLEGGTSLPAALRRVSTELRTAHPLLATELNIVQREIQLGRSPGEALRQFAVRADLEEVRGLATVILQSEKFGSSVVKALRVHAETMRGKRVLYAEEMAQKSVVKLLFPTVLFILPALFIAVLGPNAIMLLEIFRNMKN
jgi:tight adherence protein C